MPSRNLFILAAAMQLPLALWLHGCKDDDDKTTDDNKETDTTPKDTDTTPKETDTTPKQTEGEHARYFLHGNVPQLMKDLLSKAKKGGEIEFDVRAGVFSQNTDKTTATALAAFINESAEGLVQLSGPAFTYESLLKEWRVEFSGDQYDIARAQQPVSPGLFPVNALQNYMQDKAQAVIFNQQRFNGGITSAESVVCESLSNGEVIVVDPQQRKLPNRNFILTELYHNGYKHATHAPKRNPYHMAVTYFQFDEDLETFFQICERAFRQILSVNQMMRMKPSEEDLKNFLKVDGDEKKEFSEFSAWEFIEKKDPNSDLVYTRRPTIGSRQPCNGDLAFRNRKTIQVYAEKIEGVRMQLHTDVRFKFNAPEGQAYRKEFDAVHQPDISKHDDFIAWMGAIANGESGTEDRSIQKQLEKIEEYAEQIWNEIYADANKMKKTAIKKVTGVDAKKTPKEGAEIIQLPEFLVKLLTTGQRITPAKAGQVAWEEFALQMARAHGVSYAMPNEEQMMSLDSYKIEVLEVVHTGKNAHTKFAEVMMAAFYNAWKTIKANPFMQQGTNGQIFLGDSSAIYGHTYGNQMMYNQQPPSRTIPFEYEIDMFKTLRFVTLEPMTQGEQSVECFQTIAERLSTSDVEVIIKEHVEVVDQIAPKKNKSDKSRVSSHINKRHLKY